ncbi:thioesterase II family protein [Longispora albida]|uniref:thioesterase II family protein n=1 Tax=Longispora albida TaxID=203523 RepID=UPI0003696486|nr:alpha/beta fold hydrolase [Longispora albida]
MGWLHPSDPDPDARVLLYLFHHSGAGATMYGGWPELLPSDIACRRVQLPGRQERHAEQPYTELDPLVTELGRVLAAEHDGRPRVLFGHSMGALLAYRLALSARPVPALLAVAGWAPAGLSPGDAQPGTAALPPIPQGGLIAPAMTADTTVVLGYRDDHAKLACPVVAYAGRDDQLFTPAAHRDWGSRAASFPGVTTFPGDHFFLAGQAPAVVADLVRRIREVT